MSHQERQKFASQIDSGLLEDLRRIASREGRQLQSLIEEAVRDLLEKHRRARPRSHVLAHYQTSHEAFDELYRKLAK